MLKALRFWRRADVRRRTDSGASESRRSHVASGVDWLGRGRAKQRDREGQGPRRCAGDPLVRYYLVVFLTAVLALPTASFAVPTAGPPRLSPQVSYRRRSYRPLP